MSRDKQMFNDLVEIFEEEYGKRNLITPQNTVEKLTAKGYRKSTDVAEEIFAELEKIIEVDNEGKASFDIREFHHKIEKKYTEEGK